MTLIDQRKAAYSRNDQGFRDILKEASESQTIRISMTVPAGGVLIILATLT